MTENPRSEKLPCSFRDPDGYIFSQENIIYRYITHSYKDDYDHLISSGLYKKLVDFNFLISHQEVDKKKLNSDDAYKVIKPEHVPFISYPYEWCFSQLKQAALLTLKVQKAALDLDMSLKDCSAYNIQFKCNHPVFIDTLSFAKYRKHQLWVGYKQFCEHFLAPLALISYKDHRLTQLLKTHLDGIPLDLTSKLLPLRTHINLPIFLHIHLHAKSQKHLTHKTKLGFLKPNKNSLLGLIKQLEQLVQELNWHPKDTYWDKYYSNTTYTSIAFEHKKQLVSRFLNIIKPDNVWDLGANTGAISRVSSQKDIPIIAFDSDAAAVEKNYLQCLREKETKLFPLILDLSNPSPDIGWNNQERMSLIKRGPANTIFALALLHHLAIGNNVPFDKIAKFFSDICTWAIIEFVPKEDPQVKYLLASRKDIFSEYTKETFELIFQKYFQLKSCEKINDSTRTIYLFKKH